jgi:GDP-L-fucose synthase|tara:strand:- start:1990 stop:2892 length:903 start_codon:yes stop_codon:yes gene_type:complete
MSKILVTGGSGLVGKHLQDILPEAVYISSKDYDLLDYKQVRVMMDDYEPSVVIHLAARVGGIVDNINYPVDYLEENVLMNTNVLKACHEFNVEKVISILSTCIYPDVVDTYPMKEEDLFNGPPTPTNFSYGFAKRCMAAHIDAYRKQYDKKWCYLIPCNLYGEHDKYEEHHSHFVSALIKKIYEADDSIELWGTGKPLRQFMYGGDLARVIKYMLDNDVVDNFNVAPEWVHSINDLANIGKKACLKENLVVNYDSTKPDGQFRKDVDSSKLLSVLKDFKFTSLEEGIKKVYDKFSKRYDR